MRLGDRDQPVQTLTSYRTDHPFANSIRLRAVRRRFQYPQAQRPDRLIQVRREDAIPVVNQVTVSVFIADDLPQLLQGPAADYFTRQYRRDCEFAKYTYQLHFIHSRSITNDCTRGVTIQRTRGVQNSTRINSAGDSTSRQLLFCDGRRRCFGEKRPDAVTHR